MEVKGAKLIYTIPLRNKVFPAMINHVFKIFPRRFLSCFFRLFFLIKLITTKYLFIIGADCHISINFSSGFGVTFLFIIYMMLQTELESTQSYYCYS